MLEKNLEAELELAISSPKNLKQYVIKENKNRKKKKFLLLK